jgi:enterochelin esterase-like enzyme
MPSGFSRLPAATGRLLATELTGPVSGVRMRVWVWLPPQYDDPAYAARQFPALMLYPGGSGAGYNTWAGTQYGAQSLVSAGARAGTLTPFVFVMPAMQLSERQDTECADLPGQPRVGTFLAVDVRQLIESTFRVRHDRTGWGAAGASAGAYCALRIVFNHPDQYTAAVSIDGYFSLQTPLPHAATPTVLAQDPATLATSRPPDVSVLVWSGDKRGPDLDRARTFVASAQPPTRIQLRLLPHGRHTTHDFARMMPDTFNYLTQELSRP